jgi:hypothetical protein
LSVVAFPLVFGIGFWTRCLQGSGEGAADHGEPGAAAANITAEYSVRDPGTKPADLASAREAVSAMPNEYGILDRRQHPVDSQTGESGRDTLDSTPPISAIVALPADRGERNVALSHSRVTGDDLATSFSLMTLGHVRQITAEVLRPASTWFDIAASDAACATGNCPAPVRNLDRKLNTALNWSATPGAAAAEADREGKLVFLIHVSGNFAQPGFT